MLEKLNLNLSRDIGIDLGTCSVLVHVDGKGIVLNEPSVVAMDTTTDKVVKVGKEALAMIGRTPDHITTMRPLKDGVISQYDVTLHMLQYFIRRACGKTLLRPRVMIGVPTGITEVEERAVLDAAAEAGARKTFLVEEPKAALLGAGVDINSPIGNMIVDVGGGTTDIAVVAMGGIVVSESVKIAGDKFDEAIMQYVRRQYNLLIGERTAEAIKIQIGAVYDHGEAKTIQVKGRDLGTGMPRVITLSSKEMMEAMIEPVTAILDAVCAIIERTPPDLLGDILKNGIHMAGGGSLLYGLDKLITRVTGIKTTVAKNPISCVAVGTGKYLSEISQLHDVVGGLTRDKDTKPKSNDKNNR